MKEKPCLHCVLTRALADYMETYPPNSPEDILDHLARVVGAVVSAPDEHGEKLLFVGHFLRAFMDDCLARNIDLIKAAGFTIQ